MSSSLYRLIGLGLLSLSTWVGATNFQSDSFQTYKDTNGNLYFLAQPKLLILAGEINTPIQYRDGDSFKFSPANNQFSVISHSYNTNGLQVSTDFQTYYGDFNYDGKKDIYMHPKDTGGFIEGYLIYGFGGSAPTKVSDYQSFDGIPVYDLSVQTVDTNGDGKRDLIFISDSGEEYTPFNYQPKLPETAPVGGSLVGRTEFDASVSKGGSASVQVPLKTPVGATGLSASLLMSYNSQVNSGTMGRGWSLAGLGSITRCQAEYPNNTGIKYEQDGEYCFQGERLVAIQGSHGASGTYYRTEIDQGVLVQSNGQALNGPAWWSVQYADGTTEEYGATTDSRVELSDGRAVKSWAINKKTLTSLASYTISYYEDQSAGSHRVRRIDYLNQNASIEFHWIERAEKYSGWNDGARTANTHLLKRVEMKADGATQRNYVVHYEQDARTNRPMVTSIQECSNENTCLNPLSFDWQSSNEIRSFSKRATLPGIINYTSNINSTQQVTGDINGDGFVDIVMVETAYSLHNIDHVVHVYINNGSGVYTDKGSLGISLEDDDLEGANIQLIDMNYDGYSDLVANTKDKVATWFASSTTGSTNFSGPVMFDSVDLQERRDIADMDGDGYPDLLTHKNLPFAQRYVTRIYKGNGAGRFSTNVEVTLEPEQASYSPLSVQDIDGDGLMDLLFHNYDFKYEGEIDECMFGCPNATKALYFYHAKSRSFDYEKVVVPTADNELTRHNRFLDITNDGVPDRLVEDASKKLFIYEGQGDGQFSSSPLATYDLRYAVESTEIDSDSDAEYAGEPEPLPSGEEPKRLLQFTDINNDGRIDIIQHKPNEKHGNFYVRYGTAQGFTTAHTIEGLSKETNSNVSLVFLDLNGDSVRDMLRYYPSTGKVETYQSNANASPMLTSVLDGQGVRTTFDWGRMNESNLYTKGTQARVAGEKDIVTSRPLVSRLERERVNESDDEGLLSVEYYRYAGAVQKAGRDGYLGFSHFIKTTDRTELDSENSETEGSLTRSLITATYLRQDAPYVGKTAKLVTYNVVNNAADANSLVGFVQDSSDVFWPKYGNLYIGKNATLVSNWRENQWTSLNANGIKYLYQNKYITRQYDYTAQERLLRQTEYETTKVVPQGAYFARTQNIVTRTGAKENGDYRNTTTTTYTYENHGSIGQARDFWIETERKVYSEPGKPTLSDYVTYDYTGSGQVEMEERYSSNDGLPKFESSSAVRTEYEYTEEPIRTLYKTTVSNPYRVEATTGNGSAYSEPRVTYSEYSASEGYKYLTRKAVAVSEAADIDTMSNHVTQYSYFDIFGNAGRVVAPNGLANTRTTDAMGQFVAQTNSMGVVTSIDRGFCTSTTCPSGGHTYEKVTIKKWGKHAQPANVTYYDALGREIGQAVQRSNGKWSITRKTWDRFNRLVSESVPELSDTAEATPGAVYNKTYFYDLNDRIVRVVTNNSTDSGLPNNVRSIDYKVHGTAGGYTKTITDGKGRVRHEDYDAQERLVSTREDYEFVQVKISHVYDAKGRKIETNYPPLAVGATDGVVDPGGNPYVDQWVYDDEAGLVQESLVDREGSISRYQNIFGDAYKTINAKGDIAFTQHDALSRPIQRLRDGILTCWYYDGKGTSGSTDLDKGTLTSVVTFQEDATATCPINLELDALATPENLVEGGILDKVELAKTYKYHSVHGQAIEEVVYVDDLVFVTEYSYDSFGRKSSIHYPTAYKDSTHEDGSLKNTVSMGIEYDDYGYAKRLTNDLPVGVNGRVVYKENDGTDAFGNVIEKVLSGTTVKVGYDSASQRVTSLDAYQTDNANSSVIDYTYSYNAVGEMVHRAEGVSGREESFGYGDGYGRQLTSVKVKSIGEADSSYREEEAFSYDAYGNLRLKVWNDVDDPEGIRTIQRRYRYDGKKLVEVEQEALLKARSGKNLFGDVVYDDAGNVTSFGYADSTKAQDHIAYNSINKVSQVKQYRSDYAHDVIDYKYDEQGSRYYRQSVNNNVITKTYIIGGIYERVATGNTVEHRHYLGNETLVVLKEDGAEHVQHFVRDHLGSVVGVVNTEGQVLAQYRYRVFGEQVSVLRSDSLIPQALGITEKGFTDHEHMDGLDYIHMNGRLYHAGLGRFVQTDIVVQNLKAPINYNRYAYVTNNPLGYTDPTGYLTWSDLNPLNWFDGDEGSEAGGVKNDSNDSGSNERTPDVEQNAVNGPGPTNGEEMSPLNEKYEPIEGARAYNEGHMIVRDLSTGAYIEIPDPRLPAPAGDDGWFIQVGIVGSLGPGAQLGGDGGFYFGKDSTGEYAAGTYLTGSFSATTSAGADGGLMFSISNSSVSKIAGPTTGLASGVDTPIADVMVGTEVFEDGSGAVVNLQLTVGPEVSAGLLVGVEGNVNFTTTQEFIRW